MGSSVIRGTFWILLGRILPQCYLVVSSIVLARVLGATDLGRLTFITITASTLATLVGLGFPHSVNRHIAETLGAGRVEDVGGLYRWWWKVGAVAAGVAGLACWAVALFGGEPRAAWLLAGVSSAALVLHQVPSVLLIGARRWRSAMIVGTTTGFVSLVVRILVLLGGGEIVAMLAIDAVFATANVVLTSALARRALREMSRVRRHDPELIRRTVRFASIASVGIVITWVVFQRSEVFFLQYFSTPDQIAIYSIPFTAVATLLFIPQAMTFVVGPTLTTLHGAGEGDRVREGYGRALRIVTTVMVVLTAYAFAVGPTAVTVLYGSEFNRSAEVLRILLVSAPLVPVWTLSNALLTSLGRQWFATLVVTVAAVVNVALDVVLISAYDAIGAAVANASAQVVAAVPLFFYTRRVVPGISLGRFVLVRVGVVSAVSALCALAVVLVLPTAAGLVIATVVFAGATLLVAYFVPILTAGDAIALAERLGVRGRGIPRRVLDAVSAHSISNPRVGPIPGAGDPLDESRGPAR